MAKKIRRIRKLEVTTEATGRDVKITKRTPGGKTITNKKGIS